MRDSFSITGDILLITVYSIPVAFTDLYDFEFTIIFADIDLIHFSRSL